MELNDKEKEIVSNMKPLHRLIFNTIMKWLKMLFNGDCDDDTIVDAVSKINSSKEGYVAEDDYVTLDGAMRILGYGQNRVGCLNLLHKHGIYNETFNTVNIGYNRDKIVAVKKKLRDEYDARILKQRNKERKNKGGSK